MSLLIALVGKQKVVVCADSRGVYGNGSHAADCFQKLFQFGPNSILGVTGLIVAEIRVANPLLEAPRELLKAMRDDLLPLLTGHFKQAPLPNDPMVFGAFALRRKSNGELDLLELQFPIQASESGERFLAKPSIKTLFEGIIPRGRFAYSLGHGDCLTKKLEQKLNPDVCSDSAILSGIDGIFEGARTENTECGHEIGGPIDIAVIDSNGFHWLRKKPAPMPTQNT